MRYNVFTVVPHISFPNLYYDAIMFEKQRQREVSLNNHEFCLLVCLFVLFCFYFCFALFFFVVVVFNSITHFYIMYRVTV